MDRHRIIAAVAALAACVLLAACSGSSGSTPSPDPSASPSAEPTTSIVTGIVTCGADPADTDGEDDLVMAQCEWATSDPRLNGTQHVVVLGPDDLPPGLHTSWSQEAPLTTADGAWDCKQFTLGSFDIGTGLIDEVCRGTGPYAGLVAYLHGTSDDALSTYGITGWISEEE